MLHAINEVGMDILCIEQSAKRIVRWIATKNHTFPKTKQGWINLLNTQFRWYKPTLKNICSLYNAHYVPVGVSIGQHMVDQSLMIHTDPTLLITQLKEWKVLYGSHRKLHANKYAASILNLNYGPAT